MCIAMSDRQWKIYYKGGGSFTDEDGPPEMAPGRGVILIIQRDERVGRVLIRSDHFYVYSEELGGWQGVDYFGLSQYIIEGGLLVIKLGQTVSNEEWNDAIGRQARDDYLPLKSAHYKKEREQDVIRG